MTSVTPDDEEVLSLEFKGVTHEDLKVILTKLHTDRKQRRRQKCPRLDGVDARIARLSSSSKISKMDFHGNTGIGDEGMEHLHLIPETVQDLDFSGCYLTCSGIKTLCKWLEGNKHIKSMKLWGNYMVDEASRAVGEMLGKNDTLEELYISPIKWRRSPRVTWRAARYVCAGLRQNCTLRHFSFSNLGERDDIEFECGWLRAFASFAFANPSPLSKPCKLDVFPQHVKSTTNRGKI